MNFKKKKKTIVSKTIILFRKYVRFPVVLYYFCYFSRKQLKFFNFYLPDKMFYQKPPLLCRRLKYFFFYKTRQTQKRTLTYHVNQYVLFASLRFKKYNVAKFTMLKPRIDNRGYWNPSFYKNHTVFTLFLSLYYINITITFKASVWWYASWFICLVDFNCLHI